MCPVSQQEIVGTCLGFGLDDAEVQAEGGPESQVDSGS